MEKKAGLERFLEVHQEEYEEVLEEIQNGCIKGNWVCYFFPSLKDLETDCMYKYYGLEDLQEAEEYLQNETLQSHLEELCTELLNYYDLRNLFSSEDIRRIRSCVTLFMEADQENELWQEFLDQLLDGKVCSQTMEVINEGVTLEEEM